MKTLLISISLFLISSFALCQNIIQSDTSINKTIGIADTFDLQFIHWPSPGFGWKLYSEYDTTVISIKKISSKLMEGNFPKGGKYINTIQFKGNKSGEVILEYFWGRPWLKEKLKRCQIKIIIK
jgi:predicted secreted protein